MPASSQDTPSSEPEQTLSGTARALISLAVVIHLFCVFVALTANAVNVSELHSRLAGKLAAYTQSLNFEPAFVQDRSANVNEVVPYFLTYNRQLFDSTIPPIEHARSPDCDHRIEVLPEGKEATDPTQWIVIPDGGFRAGEQYKRQQRFARNLGFFGTTPNNEDPAATLTRSIVRHYLVERGVRLQMVRASRHAPIDWISARQGTPEQRDPQNQMYFSVPYTGQVLIGEDGSIGVIKVIPENESAGAAGENP